MISSYLPQLSNHLWQSTLFAGVAWLVTIALRRYQAKTRYWIWLAASMKFLIPFSLLVTAGSQFHIQAPTRVESSAYPVVIGQVLAPAWTVPAAVTPTQVRARSPWNPALLLAIWVIGFAVVLFSWCREWLRIRAAVKTGKPIRLDTEIEAVSSNVISEPGVYGIWRPVLMLPDGICDRLAPGKLQAILAHELCHVRRRDNLFAAIHMAIEAVFWFYPVVWWLGRRLVAERENACDEEVLRLGNDPRIYAESILEVCAYYLESSLPCVAGVTGSTLKKRIRAIMANRGSQKLSAGTKWLLAAAGATALIVPTIIGALNVSPMKAQSQTPLAFEVASVRPKKATMPSGWGGAQFLPGGRFSAKGVPVFFLIAMAYHLPFQSPQLTGGPDWTRSEPFDIEAVAEKSASGEAIPDGNIRVMLQTLLAERFKLVMRHETKDLPVYVVVASKNGPKLQESKVDEKQCAALASAPDRIPCHSFQGGMGRGLHATAVSMADLALAVSNWADRPVIDKTGLQGLYALETDGWAAMRPRLGPAGEGPEAEALADPTRPTLFTIFDRLGLKLDKQRAPVDMYVIDHVERPTEN